MSENIGATVNLEKSSSGAVPAGLEIHTMKWGTAEEIHDSLTRLYQHAEQHAVKEISWYGRKMSRKAKVSTRLRLLAIFWTTLGGLMPIVGSIGWGKFNLPVTAIKMDLGHLGNVGYLFLAFAAASVGLDRFFGYSSGWMRYITTKMGLERRLSEFRFDWAMMLAKLAENKPATDQVQLMIQRLKEFMITVHSDVDQETQVWISEFKTNLAEVEKSAKAQADTNRPGAVDITLTNGMKTDKGFMVSIDGMEVKQVHGTQYQIGYVPPGPHRIAVMGHVGGQQVDASALVNVAPGSIASVTLAFPEEVKPGD